MKEVVDRKNRDKYMKIILENDGFFVKDLPKNAGHFCGQKRKMDTFILGFAIFWSWVCEKMTKKWPFVPNKCPFVPVRISKWYSKYNNTDCKYSVICEKC